MLMIRSYGFLLVLTSTVVEPNKAAVGSVGLDSPVFIPLPRVVLSNPFIVLCFDDCTLERDTIKMIRFELLYVKICVHIFYLE